MHKKAKSLNNETAWVTFRQFRNEVTKQIRKAKSEYQNKLIDKMKSSNTNTKTWFKLAKQINNKQKHSTIPTLLHNGSTANTEQEKAELLNNFFCSQSSLDDSNHPLPDLPEPGVSFSSIEITRQDVSDAILLMDPTKASGPNLISPDCCGTVLTLYQNH